MSASLPSAHDLAAGLVVAQLAAPAATLLAIAIPALVGRPPSERSTTRTIATGFGLAFLAAVASLILGAARGAAVQVRRQADGVGLGVGLSLGAAT